MNLYFDTTATTKVCDEAVVAMKEMFEIQYGNPSSKHFEGLAAEDRITEVRKLLAKEIGAGKEDVYFTSGGTESNNLAVLGVARVNKRDRNHVITTVIEHPSVGKAVDALGDEGFEVSKLSVDDDGFVDLDELRSLITENTALVSVMQVNNEIGTIQKIKEIGALIKEVNPKTVFHVDGVQSFMKFPVNVKQCKIDLYSGSSHKIYGPKGCGFLYVKNGTKLKPMQFGGSQQKAVRPGTENVPGIVGFGAAVKALSGGVEANYKAVMELKTYFVTELKKVLPEWKVNSPVSNGLFESEVASPYIVSVRSESLKGEVVLHALEDYKICVSTGSACSSKKLNVSHVLNSLGLSDVENDKAIRVSLSAHQSKEDVDELVKALKSVDMMFGRFVKK